MNAMPGGGIPEDSPELGLLVEILRDHTRPGAVILGGPGTGKSSLKQAALDLAGLNGSVHTVQCIRSLREVPYGALLPLLTDLEEPSTPVEVLRALQHLGPDPMIVVVDVQYLDAASAFLLAQLVQNRAARLLASGTGTLGHESGIAALSETGVLHTIHLEGHTRGRVRRQCEQVLGGPLTEGTVRTIHGMTGGNPQLVDAFLESGLRQGVLVQAPDGPAVPGAPDPWLLLRPAPDPDAGLIDTVESMQGALLPGEQDCLDLVALAGIASRARVRAVAGDHVPDLLETGFLREVDGHTVTLASALHAEVLRASIPPGRSLDLFNRWQATVGVPGAVGGQPAARLVLWALECDQAVDLEEIINAGYRALSVKDMPTARALTPFLADRQDPRAGLLVAELMLAAGRTWAARAELEDLAARTDDPDRRAEIYSLLAIDLVRTGHAPHGWAALGEVLNGVRTRTQARQIFPEAMAAMVRTLVGSEIEDRRADLLEQAGTLLATPDLDESTRLLMNLLQADLLGYAGRCAEALTAAAAVDELMTVSPKFSARLGLHALATLVVHQVIAGRLDEARRTLEREDHREPRQWHVRSGTVLALRALVEAAQGGTAGPGSDLWEAVVELRQDDPCGLLGLCEAILAMQRSAQSPTAPQAPDPSGAGAEERVDLPQRGPRARWLLSLALHSLAEDSRRVLTDDHQPLWRRLLEDQRLDDALLVRREILFALVVERPPDVEDDGAMCRLHGVCAAFDDNRSGVLARMSDPALGGDPRALAVAAEELTIAGEVVPSAVAWSRLVLVHHSSGDLRRRGEALRRLQRLRASTGVSLPAYVEGTLALGELTAREQEIVDLVSAGLSNAEVAGRLFVSTRTVEGHLYRVYTKLGITTRAELRDAMA